MLSLLFLVRADVEPCRWFRSEHGQDVFAIEVLFGPLRRGVFAEIGAFVNDEICGSPLEHQKNIINNEMMRHN